MKRPSQIVLFVLLSATLAGCSSYRFTTDIQKVSGQRSYPVKFRIVTLSYPQPPLPGDLVSFVEGYAYDEKGMFREISKDSLCGLLAEKAESRYPKLFTQQKVSFPLHVTVHCKDRRVSYESFLLEFATLAVMPVILPLPFSTRGNFEIRVDAVSGDTESRLGVASFSRKDYVWFSFSPLGLLIPPGKSEKAKFSNVGFLTSKAYSTSGELTLESISDAIAKVLQQRDLTPEIKEYIKSQRKF